MIAAMDVDGFIPSTIEIVRRDNTPDGDLGTVDKEKFVDWVKHKLCPTLGQYALGEPWSIVVMDNAATYMDERIEELIRSAGAYLIYTAPYSPDLNPIEYGFNLYKTYLKKNSENFNINWYHTHLEALESVTRDICIKEFRHCSVPLNNETLTSNEIEELAVVALLLI